MHRYINSINAMVRSSYASLIAYISSLVSRMPAVLSHLKKRTGSIVSSWSLRRRGAVVAVLVLLSARMAWGFGTTLWNARPLTVPVLPPIVHVERILPTHFREELSALGTVRGDAELPLKFETKGVLDALHANEGQPIPAGALLATLNQRDASLRLQFMQRRLEEHQTLFTIGALSQLKLDQIQLEYDLAQSEYDKTEIRATRDGIMGQYLATPGQSINPGEQIGTLVAIDAVEVEFGVVEQDVTKLIVGSAATIRVDAYPAHTFTGTVAHVLPQLDEQSRTMTARVQLPNTEGLLRPGMFARVSVVIYDKPKVLRVPLLSVVARDTQPAVFLIGEDGTAQHTPVQLGYVGQDYIEILRGVPLGALVVTNPSQGVTHGVTVELAKQI